MYIFLAVAKSLCLCFVAIECARVLQSASYNPFRGYFRVLFSKYYLWVLFAQTCVAVIGFTLGYDWLVTVFLAIFSLLVNFTDKKNAARFHQARGSDVRRAVRRANVFILVFAVRVVRCGAARHGSFGKRRLFARGNGNQLLLCA